MRHYFTGVRGHLEKLGSNGPAGSVDSSDLHSKLDEPDEIMSNSQPEINDIVVGANPSSRHALLDDQISSIKFCSESSGTITEEEGTCYFRE